VGQRGHPAWTLGDVDPPASVLRGYDPRPVIVQETKLPGAPLRGGGGRAAGVEAGA